MTAGNVCLSLFSGFRADGSMGLAFGGQASKPYSQQKFIAAFHVDKIFDRASCNGWGDAYAFGDPSSANFGAQGRRQLLCGRTEAGPCTAWRPLFGSSSCCVDAETTGIVPLDTS